MPPRQRTFELVPTTLVKSNGPKPPMTSKAAKKAYLAANRGPRISRAEQRKRDAEELERQKKEYERERAWAKAKAAREKKAEKENAEKAARRKMGLPEPSKYVRASQPTISMFVKGGKWKRSWQQMESGAEDSEATIDDEDSGKDEAKPPAKRVAVIDDSETTLKETESLSTAQLEPAKRINSTETPKTTPYNRIFDQDQMELHMKATSVIDDSEDEFGEFPSLSQSDDILEKIDSSILSIQEGVCSPENPEKGTSRAEREDEHELPARKSLDDEEFSFDDDELLADMVTTQLLSEAAEAASKSDAIESFVPEIPSSPPKQAMETIFTNNLPSTRSVNSRSQVEYRTPTPITQPVLKERSINMPPPRLPWKEKETSSSTSMSVKPRMCPTATSKAYAKVSINNPPSATQAFLENHLDDFFPSPSQQIRELLDDIDDFDLPSNTQIAQELSSPAKPAKDPYFGDMFCTQDLDLSPQDLLEINTPSWAPSKTPGPVLAQKDKNVTKRPHSKKRFFEEKEGDLLQAALHESKTFTARRPHNIIPNPFSKSGKWHEKNERASQTDARRRKGPFFEEKENDLLEAAIHDSKISANQNISNNFSKAGTETMGQTKIQDKPGGRIGISIRRDKVVLPAIHENKVTPQRVSLKGSPEKTKRTLKRVQSTATDYGDDDFRECFEEVAAFC